MRSACGSTRGSSARWRRARLAALELAYGRYNLKKLPTNLIDAAQAASLMALLERAELQTLSITGGDSAPLWAALADARGLASVRTIACSLYKNPYVTRAEYDAGLEGLLASPHLTGLEQLHLYVYDVPHEQRLTARAVALLITHHAHRLTRLSLPSRSDASSLDTLCAARWPALRSLRGPERMMELLAQGALGGPCEP
jgi:hypothetical protein